MKKISLSILIIFLSMTLSGCFKRDTMENISVYTTAYPVEYIVDRLYGQHSRISSIYPDGVNIDNYKLTDKQVSDYSNCDLFVYNGLGNEKDYAVKMINKNRNIKIIDASLGMEYTNAQEEIWLNPSNLLMMAQNIKSGLDEYINDPYLKAKVANKYDNLKIDISELDAEIRTVAENASNKTIIVSNDLFKYFEKYDLNVISLQANGNLTAKTISDVKNMIANKQISYIFMKQDEKVNSTIQNIIDTTGVSLLTLNSISNITQKQKDQKEDYVTLTRKNIDLLKQELYQ